MCASDVGSSKTQLASNGSAVFDNNSNGGVIETSMGGEQRHRAITKIVVLLTLFFGAICFALQGPFYPAEAAKKGVQPTEYGFVYGVFQFVILITSPLYGRYMKTIGSPFMFKSGLFVAATCTILFGFLDDAPPKKTFLFLSIAIRIVAAFGESAIYTSSYVIAIRCSLAAGMASAIAHVEIAFGIGSILGPTVGGALYQLGGFRLPFIVTGSLLLLGCFVSMYFIQEIEEACTDTSGPSLLRLIHSPSVFVFSSAIFSSAATVGLFVALLEPSVRSLNLSALHVGLLFMANGLLYALSSAIWGRFVDQKGHANFVIVIGSISQTVGLILIGPMSFVPLEKSVPLVILGLVLCGFGCGCCLVSSVIGIMDCVVECGYQKNMAAQGFVSGLYNAIFAAGCFFGPTIGGVLFDEIGFSKTSMVYSLMHTFTLVLLLTKTMCGRQRRQSLMSKQYFGNSAHLGSNGNVTQVELSYDSMTSSTAIKTIA